MKAAMTKVRGRPTPEDLVGDVDVGDVEGGMATAAPIVQTWTGSSWWPLVTTMRGASSRRIAVLDPEERARDSTVTSYWVSAQEVGFGGRRIRRCPGMTRR